MNRKYRRAFAAYYKALKAAKKDRAAYVKAHYYAKRHYVRINENPLYLNYHVWPE